MRLKLVLYFSGTAVFAFLIAVLLHETGHALAVYLTEHEIAKISFHPLSGAVTTYATSGSDPAAARFISAGGIIFGSILSLLVAWPFASRPGTPWTIPFAMIVVTSLAGNGLMLIIGSVLSSVGDVNRLITLGVSRWFLFTFGGALALLSLYFLIRLSPFVGLGSDKTYKERCLIFTGGLLPYFLCALGYNAWHHSEKMFLYVVYVIVGLVLGLVAIFICGLADPRWFGLPNKPPQIEWRHAAYTCFLAIGIIILFFLLSIFPAQI